MWGFSVNFCNGEGQNAVLIADRCGLFVEDKGGWCHDLAEDLNSDWECWVAVMSHKYF